MRRLLLTSVAVAALAWWRRPSDRTSRLPGQSITVLMPSPQSPNIAADFEAETGIKVDLQTLSWDDIRPKLVTALIAGTAPADVTEFDWSWTGQFGAAGWYRVAQRPLIDAETIKDIAGTSIFTHQRQAARRSLHQRLPRHADQPEAFHRRRHHSNAEDARRTGGRRQEDQGKGHRRLSDRPAAVGHRRGLDHLVPADQGLRRRAVRQRLQAAVHHSGFGRLQGDGIRDASC